MLQNDRVCALPYEFDVVEFGCSVWSKSVCNHHMIVKEFMSISFVLSASFTYKHDHPTHANTQFAYMVIHFLKVPKNFLRIHPKLKRPKYWVYTSSLVPILSRDLKWWVGLLTITDVYTGKCSVYSFNFWVVQNTVTILSLIWYMHIKRDFPLLTLNGLIFLIRSTDMYWGTYTLHLQHDVTFFIPSTHCQL